MEGKYKILLWITDLRDLWKATRLEAGTSVFNLGSDSGAPLLDTFNIFSLEQVYWKQAYLFDILLQMSQVMFKLYVPWDLACASCVAMATISKRSEAKLR